MLISIMSELVHIPPPPPFILICFVNGCLWGMGIERNLNALWICISLIASEAEHSSSVSLISLPIQFLLFVLEDLGS